MDIRRLHGNDQIALEQFLRQYKETSLFMLGNMARVGLVEADEAYHGVYWGLFTQKRLSAVVVQYWNGIIMMQAPQTEQLAALFQAVRANIKRPITGVLGALQQADEVVTHFCLSESQFNLYRAEQLYALDLAELIIPSVQESLELKLVRPCLKHRGILEAWLRAYELEALHAAEDEALVQRVRARVANWLESDELYLLEANQQPVAMSGFNARLPDMVQLGPVWTPPEQRNRGYARYLVAQSLALAKQAGVQTAILFTDTPAAIQAYKALGFQWIGYYRLALLREPYALNL